MADKKEVRENGALFAENALTPAGWQENVLIRWDGAGVITSVEPGGERAGAEFCARIVLPGMVNIHSHAFQRGFAGLSEYRYRADDSFWSWRKLMYDFANGMTPDQFETVANVLYREMVAAGYTSVCEFHYLHHKTGGDPFADPCEMSRRLIRAADAAGIGLTLLPVFYQYAGFGKKPPAQGQKCFIHDSDRMVSLWRSLYDTLDGTPHCVGIAPHSLRAVDFDTFRELLDRIRAVDPEVPVHMHISEQQQEVDDCLAFYGKRPVEWLMDQGIVDGHWCLVHATCMTEDEYRKVAQSHAVIGLCPSTEANLGDGIFNLKLWNELNGTWGIGSDSNTAVNPAEELMLLEYGQRLQFKIRNVCVGDRSREVADTLYLESVLGGARVSGRPVAGIMPGQCADFVSLSPDHLATAGLPAAKALSGHVFASSRQSAVDRVWTRGKLRADNQKQRTIQDADALGQIRLHFEP